MNHKIQSRWALSLALLTQSLSLTAAPPEANNETVIQHWEAIGPGHHHGINVPLFSIHSETSTGIGEFSDLIPLISWCREIGFDVIQLLPINDTGNLSSPYSGLSAFALNPTHLSLARLPEVTNYPDLKQRTQELQALTKTKRVDYPTVRAKKEQFLRLYYKYVGKKIEHTAEFRAFVEENPWLDSYALFKAKKIAYNWAPWKEWPQNETRDFKQEIAFHTFVQFLCFEEMKQVRAQAKEKGIFLKGDIPILVDRESTDVWENPHLFDVENSVGEPPNPFFSMEGQNWGLPPYRWEAHKKENFQWWKERLRVASNLYDLYRIDHIIGFFRFWVVPQGVDPKKGHYSPDKLPKMVSQGHEILKALLESCPMLPIGEDLGEIPQEIRDTLTKLGIVSTKVLRWERSWEGEAPFYPLEEYPQVSMSTVSTHDIETVPLWWKTHPEEAKALAAQKGWDYTETLSRAQLRKILQESHQSTSRLHINLLQEYLQLVPHMSSDLEESRINVPGTVADTNWSYRLPPTVEEIVSDPMLKREMRHMSQRTLVPVKVPIPRKQSPLPQEKTGF